MTPSFAIEIHKRLIDYYGVPIWRKPLPALDELISTILSQNTNDKNRDIAYNQLKARFSSWSMVREADTQSIVEAIRPAGLANQKGKRIKAILQKILPVPNKGEANDGETLSFLKTMEVEEARKWLLQFNGVGPKTAAIVLLFSLGMPAFPVDTHIYRVSGRLGLRPKELNVEQTHHYLESLFEKEAYAAVHLNLIYLGRELCKARQVLCEQCPLQDLCDFVKSK